MMIANGTERFWGGDRLLEKRRYVVIIIKRPLTGCTDDLIAPAAIR